MNHLRRARSTERNVIGRPMSTTVWETRSRYQDLLFGGVSSHSWRPSGARSVLRCMPSELFELAGGRQSGGGDWAVRQRCSQHVASPSRPAPPRSWLPIISLFCVGRRPDWYTHGPGL